MASHGGKRAGAGRKPTADMRQIGSWCQKRLKEIAKDELERLGREDAEQSGLDSFWTELNEAGPLIRAEVSRALRARATNSEWEAPNKEIKELVEELLYALQSVRHRLDGIPDEFLQDYGEPISEIAGILEDTGLAHANRRTGIGRHRKYQVFEEHGMRARVLKDCVHWYAHEHGKTVSTETVRKLWQQYEDLECRLIKYLGPPEF